MGLDEPGSSEGLETVLHLRTVRPLRERMPLQGKGQGIQGRLPAVLPAEELSRARLLAVLTQDDVCMWWSGTFLS